MLEYGIGSTEVKGDENESIAEIPQNRTLMIERLTEDAPIGPEIIHGLKTVEDVFEKFSPTIDVEFENNDGTTQTDKLMFENLGDFGVKGIIRQSNFLQELDEQKTQFHQIVKQLKKNKILRKALSQQDTKEAFLTAIYSMIKELDQVNK